MSGRLENNGTLLNALHDNKPFVYAHLVKFERPVNSLAAASDNTSRELDATKFAYLTDGAFDIVFDDGSTYKNTSDVVTSNGPQTYIANKLVSLGSFSESTDLKITSTNLTFDATTIDATLTDGFTVAVSGSDVTITATNYSFSEEGFREGDTFKFTSGSNSGNTYRIDSVYNAGKTVSVTDTTLGTTTAHASTTLTINIESQEINGLLHSTAENKISFINRRVFIYKAFFHADAPHTFIGTPILLFKGTVTSAGFEEDPEKGAKISWSISNFLADYRRVKGRITSHEAHQGYTNEGGVKGENAIRPEYALDRGFEYAEKSLSLLATYADTQKETRTKKKKIFFGLFGSVDEPYQVDVPVTREVDLRFDLQARYIPVVYGVQRVKGIPVFADLSAQLTSSKETEVFVSHAISEGPIQSILNVYVDDNALVCMSLADAKSRNPSNASSTAAEIEEANNADIQCIGRADSGQVLEGSILSASSLAYQATQNIYNPREVQISEGYEPFSQAGGSGSSSNLSYSYGSLGFTAGETGLTHEKNLHFSTPVTSTLEAHMGLPDQKASNMLVTQARAGQFKIQAQKSISNYYTAEHQLLDTAYVAGRYIIGREQTTIPSLDFVVKGKMIQAYNYDGSYKHSTLSSYSSENPSNFKPGDSVSLYSSVSFTSSAGPSYSPAGLLLSGKEILDKFFFFDHNGVKQYRFRWDLTAEEQVLLGEAKRFYMVNGLNQWHMVTYDAPDVPDTDLTTVVTVAEVLTADLTQTSTGSESFEATMSNISAPSTADYTTTDAELMLYVPEDDFASGLSPFGVNSFAKRTPVLRGNIANITGGTAIQVNNTTSTESIPSGTKVVVTNQVKLSSNASIVDDVYNGQKIIFTRLLSTAQARISGIDRVRIERTVLDYNGSSRLITLDNDVSQGLLQVGDTVTLVGETSDRPFIEEDVNKAGDLRPSTNFALITLDYLKSKRYGLQMKDQDLNLNDFLLAAVECDTQSDVSVNCMFTTPGAHFTVKAGDVYEYKDSVTGHLKWRGTVVEDRDSTGSLGQHIITFTNVSGKLTNKWNDYTYREVGDLIYDDAPGSPVGLQVITSAGIQSTSVTDNSTANVDTAITKVSGDSGSAASITLTVGAGHRNPVTSYSLYDSDSITYWKYLGWEEHTQRYVTRHQGNITIDTSKPQLENLKGLLSHFNAYLYPSEGKLRLRIEAARAVTGEESDANFNDSNTDLDVKVRYITDDDIIGKINLKDEGLSKAYNSVSASISDPMLNFDDRSVTFIDSTYKKQDNGIVKSANFSMPGITNYYNARIAAKQTLDRSRFSRQISFTMRPSGMSILPGQLIRINYPRFGWETGSEVIFRVKTVSISKDCLVSITASEYNDSVYVINKNIVSPFFIDEPIAQVSRTPGAPGSVSVPSPTTASQNIITWTAAAGISEETGRYEIWRATSFSGDAGISVTTHATLIGEVSSEELSFPDINTTTTTTQNFIYWVRAYNQSQPQTTSGIKKGTKKYYGPFNDDSDYGGVGQVAAAQAKLKALEESIIVDLTTESIALPASSSGVVSDFSNGSGTLSVFIGTTALSQGTGFTIGTPTVSSGAGTTVTVTGANYSLSGALNTESATITFPVTVLANSTTGLSTAVTRTAVMNIAKTRAGAAGAAGASGRTVELDPSSNVINYSTAGAESDTITFTATARNFLGTPYYQFFVGPVGGNLSVKQSFSTTSTFTLADSDEPGIGAAVKVLVQTKDGGTGGAIIAQDSITIFGVQDGSDAVTGFLTNESHAINANFLGGGISSFSAAGGTFKIFVGSTDVTTSCTFSVLSESGVDVSIGSSTGVYTVNSMSLDTGVASLKAVVPAATAGAASDVDIIKVYTISKSKNAAPGITGTLTNSSASVAANSAGVVTTSSLNTVGGTFEVRKDGVVINSDSAVTFGIQGSVTPSSGFSVAIDANTGAYSISGFTVDQGQVTFRATVQTSISGLSSTTTIDKTYTLSRAKEGTEAITIDLSNPVINLPTTTAGVVTYTNSGTDISVKEGSTSLNYGTSGAGTFSIAASGTNITVGSASTVSSTIRRFAAASSISADEAFITFTITIRRTTGAAAETRTVVQRLVKAKQGATGSPGADGDDAHGVEYIFAVTANESTAPSSTNNSWGFDQPASPWFDAAPSVTSTNKALWRAQRDILGSPSAGDSVTANWTSPVVVGKFGDQGESVVEVQAFRLGSNSGLSGGSYNFNTSTLTPPSGWSVNPISLTANNQVVYVGKGTSVGASTDTSASITWGSPAIYAQRTDGTNGSPGAAGLRTIQGYLFYEKTTSGAPAAPTGTTYTFSSGVVSGTGINDSGSTNVWRNSPRTQDATSSNIFWTVRYYGTESSAGSSTITVAYSTVVQQTSFTGVVTFSGGTLTDGSSSTTPLEASDVGSSGNTTIDGGRITTGVIESSNLSGTQDGSAFTTAGSLFNLSNGVIASKNFRIDSSGNAKFNGDLEAAGGTFSGALVVGGVNTAVSTVVNGAADGATAIQASDLGVSGSTVIAGNRITTGTLDASQLTVTNISADSINEINISGTTGSFTLTNSNGFTYNAAGYNTGIGQDAHANITTGSNGAVGNVAVGGSALENLTTSNYNTVVGIAAGAAITASSYSDKSGGGNNTLVGASAGRALVSGGGSTTTTSTGIIAIGARALVYATAGSGTIAIGQDALSPTFNPSAIRTESGNIGIGNRAANRLQDGGFNTLVGTNVAPGLRAGAFNTAFGYKAARGNDSIQTYGMGNTNRGSANYNVFIGYESGYLIHGNANRNIFIGTSSGTFTSSNSATAYGPTDCVVIGDNARIGTPLSGSATNRITIGADSYNATDNRIQLGNSSITSLYSYATLSQNSDERDKIEIQDNPFGLAFVKNIDSKVFRKNPRKRYNTFTRDIVEIDGEKTSTLTEGYDTEGFNAATKKDTFRSVGFIAQDLNNYISTLSDSDVAIVETSDEEEFGIRESQLIAVLWKAVQELSNKNDALEARLTALEDT